MGDVRGDFLQPPRGTTPAAVIAIQEAHTREKADTLMPHQVLASAAEQPCREICVSSPDTNVFIILVDLVSGRLLAP